MTSFADRGLFSFTDHGLNQLERLGLMEDGGGYAMAPNLNDILAEAGIKAPSPAATPPKPAQAAAPSIAPPRAAVAPPAAKAPAPTKPAAMSPDQVANEINERNARMRRRFP